jgi:hypothetical protein
MQHSQLNTIYPISPFVYDYNRINEIFDAQSQELDRNNFLLEVASVGVKHCETDQKTDDESENSELNNTDAELYRLKEMLGYLSEITIDQLNDNDFGAEYSEIRYFRTDQVINSADPKYRLDRDGRLTKQLWINFHTLAYDCTKSSAIIDSSMKEIVSWCIVPIIGNVRPMSSDSIIYSDLIDNEIKTREKRELFLKENPHLANAKEQTNKEQQTIVDCSAGQQLVNTRLQRFAQRNFIKREIEKKEEHIGDQITTKSSFSKLPINQIVKPNKQQISFTSHTRANAQNIRSAIMSKYKQSRLKNVPQQKNIHRSIDLRIRNASEKVAKTHNNEVMSRVRFMDRSYSDYRLDDAIIAKTGSIWRFTPMTSGRIMLDLSDPEYEIPSGESAYYRDPNKNTKKSKQKLEEKSKHNQYVNDAEPDYVGNAKKKEKLNTKISRVALSSVEKNSSTKQKFTEHEERVRIKPYWMARKVLTREEEEAAKIVEGDRVGENVERKTKKIKKKVKPKDMIRSSKKSSDNKRDTVDSNNSKKTDIANNVNVPDLAFVTVVRLDKVLCLTLNCLRIDNLIE